MACDAFKSHTTVGFHACRCGALQTPSVLLIPPDVQAYSFDVCLHLALRHLQRFASEQREFYRASVAYGLRGDQRHGAH